MTLIKRTQRTKGKIDCAIKPGKFNNNAMLEGKIVNILKFYCILVTMKQYLSLLPLKFLTFY